MEVDSAIVNPGIYEGVAGESVFDLIQYAGGLTPDAADKIGLNRIKPMGERGSEGTYEGHYINIENAKSDSHPKWRQNFSPPSYFMRLQHSRDHWPGKSSLVVYSLL